MCKSEQHPAFVLPSFMFGGNRAVVRRIGPIMEREKVSELATDTDTLCLFGGAAPVLFGSGLILSTALFRRYVGQVDAGNLMQAALADIDRYLKLRYM